MECGAFVHVFVQRLGLVLLALCPRLMVADWHSHSASCSIVNRVELVKTPTKMF